MATNEEKKAADQKAAEARAGDPKPALIKVQSTLPVKRDGGSQVALYEVDPKHPDGEVYIAGEGVFEVAETAGVNRAISDGRLEKV